MFVLLLFVCFFFFFFLGGGGGGGWVGGLGFTCFIIESIPHGGSFELFLVPARLI